MRQSFLTADLEFLTIGDRLHTIQLMENAAMLWTGGKDSALAMYEASQNGYRICCLVTFAPQKPNFLAHPLAFLKMQAEALQLPHHIFTIHEPFDKSYETALCELRSSLGINCVVTGDIAEVAGAPNWIRERCRPLCMKVHTPLWGRDRETLLRQLLAHGFKVRFSCVKTRWLDPSWVGRELDDAAITELRAIRENNGLDLCGEEGEYHTLVVDGPQFTRPLTIDAYSTAKTDAMAYIDISLIGASSHRRAAEGCRSPGR